LGLATGALIAGRA